MNCSIQSESAFGVVKQDYGFRQFLLRGNAKVSTEILLLAMASSLILIRKKSKKHLFFFNDCGKLKPLNILYRGSVRQPPLIFPSSVPSTLEGKLPLLLKGEKIESWDLTMASNPNREYDVVFREPEFSYCFNAAEPVEIYRDNSNDTHLFQRGELCTFEFDWKKDSKTSD